MDNVLFSADWGGIHGTDSESKRKNSQKADDGPGKNIVFTHFHGISSCFCAVRIFFNLLFVLNYTCFQCPINTKAIKIRKINDYAIDNYIDVIIIIIHDMKE